MDTVPKTFRVNIYNKTKFLQEKKINKAKLRFESMKAEGVSDNYLKLSTYEIKLDIYLYNGDLYNFYKQFKKYKKFSFIVIEKSEEQLQDDNCKVFFQQNNGSYSTDEYAYVQACKSVANNLKYYETMLDTMYKLYKFSLVSLEPLFLYFDFPDEN